MANLFPEKAYRVKLYDIITLYSETPASELTNSLLQLNNATIQIKGVPGLLKHGDMFTLSGLAATYADRTYPTLLEVVTFSTDAASGGVLAAGTATVDQRISSVTGSGGILAAGTAPTS